MNHHKYSDITRFQKQQKYLVYFYLRNFIKLILEIQTSIALIWRYNYSRWCEKFLVYYKHFLNMQLC